MGFFKSKDSMIEDTRLIMNILSKAGIDPEPTFLSEDNWPRWELSKDNVQAWIQLQQIGNITVLTISSPINKLPEDNILAFYRKCLVKNLNPYGCAIATMKDLITVTNTRPIRGLDPVEFADMLNLVVEFAGSVGKELETEFGAVRLFKKAS